MFRRTSDSRLQKARGVRHVHCKIFEKTVFSLFLGIANIRLRGRKALFQFLGSSLLLLFGSLCYSLPARAAATPHNFESKVIFVKLTTFNRDLSFTA